MPQLDLVSFLSQYFWTLIGFLVFYLYLYKNFLPKMYRIYSVRERLSHKSLDSKANQSKFQTSFTEASKTKQSLFANVMGYTQQTLQTAQVSADEWKKNHSKQLLDSSLVKFTNTFKKAVGLQALSQFIVLKYAAPLKPSTSITASLIPKPAIIKQKLASAKISKLDDSKNWESSLLKTKNAYVPVVRLKSFTTSLLSSNSINLNRTKTTNAAIASTNVTGVEIADNATAAKKTNKKSTAKAKTSSKKKA